jgi:hypothetical protein
MIMKLAVAMTLQPGYPDIAAGSTVPPRHPADPP